MAYLVVEGIVLELAGRAWRELNADLGIKRMTEDISRTLQQRTTLYEMVNNQL